VSRLAWIAAASGVFAAAAFTLCEEVIWHGQPSGSADGAAILAYYGDHAAAVQVGDVLWVLAVAALCLSAAAIAREMADQVRRLTVLSLLLAAGLVAAAGVVAFFLAVAASGGQLDAAGALAAWQREGALYNGGRVLLALPILVVVGWLVGRRAPLALALGLVGLGLAAGNVVDLLGQVPFLVAPLWLAAVGAWADGAGAAVPSRALAPPS
jgi:hypothetical protein